MVSYFLQTQTVAQFFLCDSVFGRLRFTIIEPVFCERYKLVYAPTKDSGQSAHLHSLIKGFNGCFMGSQELNVSGGKG